jgi:hypothetical protein
MDRVTGDPVIGCPGCDGRGVVEGRPCAVCTEPRARPVRRGPWVRRTTIGACPACAGTVTYDRCSGCDRRWVVRALGEAPAAARIAPSGGACSWRPDFGGGWRGAIEGIPTAYADQRLQYPKRFEERDRRRRDES